MSVHEQYNFIFKIIQDPILGPRPAIRVNYVGTLLHLQGELRSFLDRYDYIGAMDELIVEEIDKILNGTWTGFEDEGDNIFYSPTNESIKLDLNDGFAYLALDSGWDPLPRIPLTDLKAILQEWIVFKGSVLSIKKESKWYVKWLNKLRKTGKSIVKIVKRDKSF